MILTLLLLAANPNADIPEYGAGTCRAKSLQHLVGRYATQKRVNYIRRVSTAKSLRKHRDDQPVTQDYRTDRINIMVNKRNIIMRISCG
jgi:hypothetical protein